MITVNSSYQRPSTNVNKTAEQSYRKSNNYLAIGGNAGIPIEETTQRMNFKDMVYQSKKPTGV